MNYILTAPRYAKMFARDPILEEFTSLLRNATVWGGFGQGEEVEETTAGVKARSLIAGSIFQCPDRLGMMQLSQSSPMYQKFCYWIKRPMGKVVLLSIGGIVAYLLISKSGGE